MIFDTRKRCVSHAHIWLHKRTAARRRRRTNSMNIKRTTFAKGALLLKRKKDYGDTAAQQT